MDATRARLSVTAEWLPAAVLLVGTVLVAVLMVRELRMAPRALASATQTVSATTNAVPPDAVSVPALMLGANQDVRVGNFADDALAKIGSIAATLVSQAAERGPLGARDVRTYRLSGTTFILVLEPFERNGAPRVAAIYLQ
jgi:hypothetical protein